MVRLPVHSVFQGVDLTLDGGKLEQVLHFEIGKNARLTFSPSAGINSDQPSEVILDSLLVLGGGEVVFTGDVVDGDEMRMVFSESLVVRGGGLIEGNKLNITGKSFWLYMSVLIFFNLDIFKFEFEFFFK